MSYDENLIDLYDEIKDSEERDLSWIIANLQILFDYKTYEYFFEKRYNKMTRQLYDFDSIFKKVTPYLEYNWEDDWQIKFSDKARQWFASLSNDNRNHSLSKSIYYVAKGTLNGYKDFKQTILSGIQRIERNIHHENIKGSVTKTERYLSKITISMLKKSICDLVHHKLINITKLSDENKDQEDANNSSEVIKGQSINLFEWSHSKIFMSSSTEPIHAEISEEMWKELKKVTEQS